jgi:hypothetical protein
MSLFNTYTEPSQPTKVIIDDVPKADVVLVYERIKKHGSASQAWKHQVLADGSIETKADGENYPLNIYKDVEQAVKDIIAKTEEVMRSETPPATRSDLNTVIQDAGLKIAGLTVSTVITDMIAYSDGDVSTTKTYSTFKGMFTSNPV